MRTQPGALCHQGSAASRHPRRSVGETLYRERGAARRVRHPNLCPVHDVGQDGTLFYLAMPWIEGETLARTLASGAKLTTDRALGLVRTLAAALQAAHDSGIVHRDLKPANIMLRPDGEPIIIDFGMARRFDNTETVLTLSGVIAGTPGYMAPEQVAGPSEQIGPACDIYALGVVLYELLTGCAPFSGNLATILGSIVSEPPPPPRVHCPDLDPALEAICLRALAKTPAQRFAAAREFADVIDVYLREGGQAATLLLSQTAPKSPLADATPEPNRPGMFTRMLSVVFGGK
ncbi:MAG: serine/threonine-protein kinase [Planctomycetaceae bacterium]